MSVKYPRQILGTSLQGFLQVLFAILLLGRADCGHIEPEDFSTTIKIIITKDAQGIEHEELAFRAPMKGLPEPVIEMFCANVKMRLYWGVFRDEVKDSFRKGVFLRRMARLARHIFEEVADADKPFNETMLSVVDTYFPASPNKIEQSLDEKIREGKGPDRKEKENSLESLTRTESFSKKFKTLKAKLVGIKKSSSSASLNVVPESTSSASDDATSGPKDPDDLRDRLELVESSDPMKQLEKDGRTEATQRVKAFVKKWAPHIMLGVYTRYRTMWWLMMSCLFTKYYLWDPALDEFIKLKRNLVMWPELQLVRMQDLKCKPLMLFQRILDVCKIMNPLMYFDFGQLSLDKLTRFKNDIK